MASNPSAATEYPIIADPSSALSALIRESIRAEGPMPFNQFMGLALYHREHGYYASGRGAIGRRGDYFTSVSTGPVFGRLLAVQLEEMWRRLGKPARFTVVEQGAASGDLAADILDAAARDWPEMRAALHYGIVEPHARLRKIQSDRLAAAGATITWAGSLDELARFEGVHMSNELLDSMPVHLIRRSSGEWKEILVTSDGEGFAFVDGPPAAEFSRHLGKLPAGLPDGFQTEMNVDALEWIAAVARRLERGYVLAIDYGLARDEYYHPSRAEGTLTCYRHHRRSFDPLKSPGDQDITAHVEFTSLTECAAAAGLSLAGFTDQHRFAVSLVQTLVERAGDDSIFAEAERRMLMTIMHPEFLGARFKAIAFARGVDSADLCGFRFGPDPARALGLASARD